MPANGTDHDSSRHLQVLKRSAAPKGLWPSLSFSRGFCTLAWQPCKQQVNKCASVWLRPPRLLPPSLLPLPFFQACRLRRQANIAAKQSLRDQQEDQAEPLAALMRPSSSSATLNKVFCGLRKKTQTQVARAISKLLRPQGRPSRLPRPARRAQMERL